MRRFKKIIAGGLLATVIAGSFAGCTSELQLANTGFRYYGDAQVQEAEVTPTPEEQKAVALLEGVDSSFDNPLSVGETGKCQVLESTTQSNTEINIKVTGITRGEEAKNTVDAYVAGNDAITISDLPSTTEYAIVTYDISLSSHDFVNSDALPLIRMNIKGTNGESLEYDNSIYTTLSSFVISNDTSIKSGEVITLESVFAIPIGCTDYTMEFGSEEGTKAVFRCE